MNIPEDAAERIELLEKIARRVRPIDYHTWMHKPHESCDRGVSPAQLAAATTLGCWLACQLAVTTRARH